MRKLRLFTLIGILSLMIVVLSGCFNFSFGSTKLTTPVVTLVEDLASWKEIPNSSGFEFDINGKTTQVEKTFTSIKLNDNESIKVRALGDGVKYLDSDWSNPVTYNKAHTHDYSGDWKADETHHWRVCSGCSEIKDKGTHSGGTATTTNKAICSICNHSYGELKTPEQVHTHTPNVKEFFANEEYHWFKCSSCDEDVELYKTSHTFKETIKTEPTTESDGKIVYTCITCPYTKEVIIPKLPSNEVLKIEDVLSVEDGKEVCVEGVVIAINAKGFVIVDLDNNYRLNIYKGSATDGISIGSKVIVSGKMSTYNYARQINPDTVTIGETVNVINYSPTDITANIDSFFASQSSNPIIQYVSLKGNYYVSGSYHNLTINGSNVLGSIAYPIKDLSSFVNKDVVIEGWFIYVSGGKYISIVLDNIKLADNHICVPSTEYEFDNTYHWKECECGEIFEKDYHTGGTPTTTTKAICSVCNQPYGEVLGVVKLSTPSLSIDSEGCVSWDSVDNAISYEYVINNGTPYKTSYNTVYLKPNESIKVKALGDGVTYVDSEYSNTITYVVVSDTEPNHISTTVSTLANNKPTTSYDVIYEVTATWKLLDGGGTYGNGWLLDEDNSQISVYGLTQNQSILTWSDGAYTYVNDKSYNSIGISDGAIIKVGMVYNASTEQYNCYLIQIIYNPEISNIEPSHIETTIEDLTRNKPTESCKVIYEVTALWKQKEESNAAIYGNGWLYDELANEIGVYGLCSSSGVISFSNGIYNFTNDRSYSSLGLANGDKIKVGMIYNSYYDNYSCYVIEIITEPTTTESKDIDFIMINDTHGALTDSSAGNSIGRVDSVIQSLEAKGEDYIFIHNGDAFQGTYVGVETYGLSLVNALNVMNLDCFVLGNHEFDWGIDKIAQYADGNTSNGEANFPFLGANIYYKNTTTNPSWIKPYTIVEREGVKVGIIGVMGYGQESSILTRYIKDYYFASPLNIVSNYANYLRTTAGCDVVVVASHDYDETLNSNIAKLTGNSTVDAIFCAHTHQDINESLSRTDSKYIPVVQNYHKNNNATGVELILDTNNNYSSYKVTKYEPENYSISSRVQTVINSYQDIIDESNEVIGYASSKIYKSTLGSYATDALLNYDYSDFNFTGVDIAIINTGGVRAEINSGNITRSEVFEVFPFNNQVVLVNMSGKLLKSLCDSNSNYFYLDVVDSIGSYSNFSDSTIYQLAVIDYVFEGTYYKEFNQLSSSDYIESGIIMRDILMDYIEQKY